MPDHQIRITTSADTSGLEALSRHMDSLMTKAKELSTLMSKTGSGVSALSEAVGGGSVASSGSSSMVATTPDARARHEQWNAQVAQQQGAKRTGGAGAKAPYNLMSTSGLESYYENVYSQAAPVIDMLQTQNRQMNPTRRSTGGSSRSASVQSVPGFVPALGSNFKSKSMQGSTPYYEDWFNRIGQPDVQSLMTPHLRQEYQDALSMYIGGRTHTAAEFYQSYASEANQPGAPKQSVWQRIASGVAGARTGGNATGVLKSALMGEAGGGILSKLMGGSMAGGAEAGGIGGALAAGGLGALADPALLPLLAIPAAMSVFGSGYSTWKQTAPTASGIAHSLGTVPQGANVLNLSIQKAAAAFGTMGTTAIQSAAAIAQAFGGTNFSVASLTGQASRFAMANGLSDQTQTQIMTTLAALGITSGVGAVVSSHAMNRMMTAMPGLSGMQGRQGPLFTGLTSIYGTLGGINPIIGNPLGVAGQYSALNATGIQGLQGTRGAALMSSLDQGFANAQGLQQLLGFTAIMRASGGKITDPFQMMSIAEQGSAAKIGSTTYGAAYQKLVDGITSDPYLRGALMPGLDINQGMAVLKSHALLAGAAKVPTSLLNIPFTEADRNAIAVAQNAYEKAKAGQTVAIGSTFLNSLSAGALSGITNVLKVSQPSTARLLPYAKEVSKSTGIPVLDLVAQWSKESGWGNSLAATMNNNYAGIKPSGMYPAGMDPKYAGFSSMQQFARADIETLKQPRYRKALEIAQHGGSASSIFSALAAEGYSTSDPSAYGSQVQQIAEGIAQALKPVLRQILAEHRTSNATERRAEKQTERSSGAHR